MGDADGGRCEGLLHLMETGAGATEFLNGASAAVGKPRQRSAHTAELRARLVVIGLSVGPRGMETVVEDAGLRRGAGGDGEVQDRFAPSSTVLIGATPAWRTMVVFI